ncbi:MAG: hypothetical protein KF773_29280 [Deltaproteobacteria bacterium]|nr:hypothetical protein [Deltaproteobacteria bacterium]MCW5806055.1 hypothetical protein [Deltaproteobacteria bacterium]
MSTVRCTCKHPNDAWRRYCANCAAELNPACGGCGFPNRVIDKFCGGCARPLTAAARVPRPPVLPADTGPRTIPPGPPPKGTIRAQTDARNADRMHNKTTVPIDRFDVVSETTDQP